MVNLRDEERNFVEEVGVVFEQTGLPRMAGRIFGWLLISEPPYQSSAELAEVLMASKGSISTNTRLLMQLGLLERFIRPGERHDYFRLGEDALQRIIQRGLEEEIKLFRNIAQKGLEMMRGEASSRCHWLQEMYDRYTFLEKEFPALMERWQREHRASRATGKLS
jgi:DNA-binding transcriptional regulator GbsR (MarR family)